MRFILAVLVKMTENQASRLKWKRNKHTRIEQEAMHHNFRRREQTICPEIVARSRRRGLVHAGKGEVSIFDSPPQGLAVARMQPDVVEYAQPEESWV